MRERFICLTGTSLVCLSVSFNLFVWRPLSYLQFENFWFANLYTDVWRVEDIITSRKIPRSSTYCIDWLQWANASSVSDTSLVCLSVSFNLFVWTPLSYLQFENFWFANVYTVVWRIEDIITWRKIPRSSTYCVDRLQWENASSV